MSDTALWLGISEVRDAAGSLVSTYGATSISGTDWSQSVLQAVPEPSALLLFCIGALAIFGVALRTRNERA
jgi:PEP-CTERM putative exosortase interaction domain